MFDISIPTFIFAIFNFLVLYWLLKKFLFKPVTGYMQKRSQKISTSLENAKREREEADVLRRKYEEQIGNAKKEAENIKAEAKKNAREEYKKIISSAEQEAEKIIAAARDEMDRERRELIKELRSHVAGLALKAAGRVIEENMDTERNRKLVDRFLEEEGIA